jgi:hypothetical protein
LTTISNPLPESHLWMKRNSICPNPKTPQLHKKPISTNQTDVRKLQP